MLTLTGGWTFQNRGNVRLEMYQIGGASETGERETLICNDHSVPPDKEPHVVSSKPRERGLHKIVMSDSGGRTLVEWPEGVPMVFDAALPDSKLTLDQKNKNARGVYFYVPKGTETLGFCASCKTGGIYDSTGKVQWDFKAQPLIGFAELAVPLSERGKLWTFDGNGQFALMTVPPVVALSGDELMLPKEVIPSNWLFRKKRL